MPLVTSSAVESLPKGPTGKLVSILGAGLSPLHAVNTGADAVAADKTRSWRRLIFMAIPFRPFTNSVGERHKTTHLQTKI
jgi:hypothetical protein